MSESSPPTKARSRLRPDFQLPSFQPAAQHQTSIGQTATTTSHRHSQTQKRHWQPNWLALAISVPGWFGVGWIMTQVAPDTIRNWLIPDSYVPLLLCWGWGWWWLFSGIIKVRHTATWLTVTLQALLWLKLHQVQLTVWVWLGLAGLGVFAEVLWHVTHFRRQKPPAELPTK